jgi:hypothetical protein
MPTSWIETGYFYVGIWQKRVCLNACRLSGISPFCLQNWSQASFPCKLPTGRQDALDLRAWLQTQLQELNAKTPADVDKVGMLKYAEKAMDLYNAAYHELTRQVWTAHPVKLQSNAAH